MNLEELLKLDFTEPIKAHLVQKAVIAGYDVPTEHLSSACDYYERTGDFFVAADIALALDEVDRRAQLLRQAASTLIQTKEERDSELRRQLDSEEAVQYARRDYQPIQEGNGFLGGMIMLGIDGSRTDLGQLARDHRAEKGTSFERIHIDAIRCVLRGDLDEAKKMYDRLLDRAQRATRITLKAEEEMSIVLESGNFERAFEIFEQHGTNHYGGILARYLGDEERAVQLFDRQIKSTLSHKSRTSRIRGIKVGRHINYGHAAAVAETKGDIAEVIDIVTQGNDYDHLIKIAEERPDLKPEIEARVREIRDRYIDHASGLSMNSPQLKVRDGIDIWKEYGISSFELIQNTIRSRLRSRTDSVGYVSNDKKAWLSEARSMVRTSANMSNWLGDQEETKSLHFVAYKLAEINNNILGMADNAVELNDRLLLETVLSKLDQETEQSFQKTARRNVLVALGRFDEALATAQGFNRKYILEKAERWEELCGGFERNEFDHQHSGNGKIEAYKIAAEHGLVARADILYSALVRERKKARDKFGYYDLVPIIIERNDRETAQKVIEKAKTELFSSQEIDEYQARRLKDIAELARFVGDAHTENLFTTVSGLYNIRDPLTMHEVELENRSIPKKWEFEVMKPIRRYEKYVKPLEKGPSFAQCILNEPL
ncbi:TPA: hypothetical protein HA241_01975 [Candidatus Woesearchaeota archaeon]|nr:hypothetical protein [Candidatus Woesearchaeota archaeon]